MDWAEKEFLPAWLSRLQRYAAASLEARRSPIFRKVVNNPAKQRKGPSLFALDFI